MRTSKERAIISSATITTLAISIALTAGCASQAPFPAGTVKQIPSSAVVEQETVSVVSQETDQALPEDTYFLGPGDVLFINISGKPEFSTYIQDNKVIGSRVNGKGTVNLPIIGVVPVTGMSVGQAQEKIREAAQKYLKDPWVVVEILEYKAKQVFVFGAVKKPGPVPMMPAGLSLIQAVASAEPRDVGYDFGHVRIIRSLSSTRGELIVVDVERILRGDAVPFPLKDGDIVYVPRNSFGSWNDAIAEMLPSLQFVSSVLQPFVQIKFLSDDN